MKKDYIRNFKGDIIGSIETDTVTGNKIGRTFLGTIVARYNKEFNITSDFLGNVISRGDAISAALYDAYNKKNPGKLWEAVEVNTIAKQTCGYIKPDGSLIELDEYHGEDETLRDLKYIEYSNTHFEEDTCVRIYKEPTEAQYKRLQEIIDLYLDWEGYCKIEIWLSSYKYRFYKVFSIIEGACPGYEEVFNETWTGEKLCRIIRNQFSRVWDPELHESSDWVKLSEGKFEGKSIKYGDIKLTEADKTALTNWVKEHFICSKTFTGNSCYLLADGTYLDVGDAHSNIDQSILDFLRDHNYIDDIDNEWATLSEHFIDINLNAMHCGNNHYDYIVVDPRCNPTQAQYKALESYDLYYLDHEEGYDISIGDSTDCRRSAVYYDADKHELVDCYGRKTSAAAKISSYYANNKLTFNINEATRNQLITKSRRADFYSDKAKGNRWTAKSQCKIASTVKDYNRIDMDTFWKLMDERLELCHRALQVRHKRLSKVTSDVAPILWQHGALARLGKGESIHDLLHGGYSTLSLGYAGLYECVKYMTGHSHTDNGKGKEFALQVMQKLNDKCKEWKEAEDIDYSLYGTPIESTTYKFAKCLRDRFGKIKGITDRDYITNSYHVPVFEEIDAFTKLKLESEFQRLSPGGAISYIETPNLENNIDVVMEVINFIYENIMYAELNTKSDYCQVCGYDGEMKIDDNMNWYCPNCDNHDQTKLNVARRTCGYIGSNFWNYGRTEEIKDRVIHLDD